VRGFLLDTNVVSELFKNAPEPRVLGWLSNRTAAEFYLATVTLAELVRGATRLPDGETRERLKSWTENDLRERFAGRILSFDEQCALICGRFMGEGDRRGKPRPFADIQIAATAMRFELTLVTRNVREFRDMPIKVIDPWSPA
jgi:predicted nucleic acid-binding protein